MTKLFKFISNKFKKLGPGFITGAADDDPSGIATYSIAGAQFGYQTTWLCVFLTPLMIGVQEMCGRIGMVSGNGIAGVLRKYYSKKLLYCVVFLLFIANTINIGANLGIMAASVQMLVGQSFAFWLIVVTFFTIFMEVFIPYNRYSNFLKWMGLSLLVYGVTALIVRQDWVSVIRYTFFPSIQLNLTFIMTLVGFLGTTISPYLFFWQASEQVEEHISGGKIADFAERPVIDKHEISHMLKDTSAGMIFSNITSFFIIITTAATLHRNGIFNIETPQQAALALKPLAGPFTYLLFTIGIIGIGLQSVPILAGGVAYAFAEAFGFKQGLAKKLTEAKAFYFTIAAATLIGLAINLLRINAIAALYYAAIVNGIIAVPLIFIIIRLANDKRIVGEFKSKPIIKASSWAAFILMGLAVVLMMVQILIQLLPSIRFS